MGVAPHGRLRPIAHATAKRLVDPLGQAAVVGREPGHAERHHEQSRDQRQSGEHRRPVALEELPRRGEHLLGAVVGEREDPDDAKKREHEADVEQQEEHEVAHRAEARPDDRRDRREVRKRRRQLDCGDRRPQDPAGLALGVEVGWIAPRERCPMTPDHGGRGDHRGADRDLDDRGDVVMRVGEQRPDQLSGADRDRRAAHEIDGEHSRGELRHAVARVLAGRQVQRRRDRRRVERVGQPDRDDDADQPKHARILYFSEWALRDR